LARAGPNLCLDHTGDPLHVPPEDFVVVGRPRLELECWMNSEPMGLPIRVPAQEDRQDGDSALRREGDRPIASTRHPSEETDENTLLAASVLVEHHHHLAAGLEGAYHADSRPAHRNRVQRRGPIRQVGPCTTKAQHGAIDDRLAQPAIDERNRNPDCDDLGAGKLPISEMRRHDQSSARRRQALRRLEMFEPVDLNPIEQLGSTTPPEQHELRKPPTQMNEDLPRPFFATGGILFGKRGLQLIANAPAPWPSQPVPRSTQFRAERNRSIDRNAF